MRFFIASSFFVFLIVAGITTGKFFSVISDNANLAAAYTNDTEIIQAAIDGPEIPPPENTVTVGVDPATIDYGNQNNQNAQNENEEVIVLEDEESTPVSDEEGNVVVETVEVTNMNSQQNDEVQNETEEVAPPSQTVAAEDIIASLVGNQAVVTSLEESIGSFFSNLFGGGGNGQVTQIRINAEKVRSSLRARNIATFQIPNIRNSFGTSRDVFQGMSRDDFTIFVASAVLQDEYLSDVSYAGGRLTTEYRAFGRLFGVLPMRYTLGVTVVLSSNGLQTVELRYPWYSFFLATGISKSALERELHSEIAIQIQSNEGEFDVATRAFTAVSEVLKLRVGV